MILFAHHGVEFFHVAPSSFEDKALDAGWYWTTPRPGSFRGPYAFEADARRDAESRLDRGLIGRLLTH